MSQLCSLPKIPLWVAGEISRANLDLVLRRTLTSWIPLVHELCLGGDTDPPESLHLDPLSLRSHRELERS